MINIFLHFWICFAIYKSDGIVSQVCKGCNDVMSAATKKQRLMMVEFGNLP